MHGICVPHRLRAAPARVAVSATDANPSVWALQRFAGCEFPVQQPLDLWSCMCFSRPPRRDRTLRLRHPSIHRHILPPHQHPSSWALPSPSAPPRAPPRTAGTHRTSPATTTRPRSTSTRSTRSRLPRSSMPTPSATTGRPVSSLLCFSRVTGATICDWTVRPRNCHASASQGFCVGGEGEAHMLNLRWNNRCLPDRVRARHRRRRLLLHERHHPGQVEPLARLPAGRRLARLLRTQSHSPHPNRCALLLHAFHQNTLHRARRFDARIMNAPSTAGATTRSRAATG